MKTILTGIRVNSEPTLGNFLGALLPMTRLANKYSKQGDIVNIFIPDLHTIISDVDGDITEGVIREIKYYLAAGLEPNENIHIYRQSYVPAHSELNWILNCVATMGETSRMIQYKEKSEGKDSCNVAIFDYPILMAADILLYDATYVPVGEDQFQHLELTRNLAERFNNKYGEVFVLPAKTADQAKFMETANAETAESEHVDADGRAVGIRIRDLQDPTKKMSKSSKAENSKIMMSDNPEAVAKKIMSAQTDSLGKISFDMFNQPGISNLLQIEALITGQPLQTVIGTWAGETHYGDLKKKVAESVSTFLGEFQAKVAEISDEEVLRLLEAGEKYANEVAGKKLLEVQKAVGLRK
ncbi:MAG: tryptophan--tRNA ligase [Candidatus Saccharibacteria bacterium]|nr:tryptophan--tRNA ligase [Candidatus Saccharibacteria bacterium]